MNHDQAAQHPYEHDIRFARRALAGAESDWHAFVERYSPLIRSVVRRYCHDPDAVADVWVEILRKLRGGVLAQYEGRASLATWLTLVARSTAFDHLRRERGRRRMPAALNDQSEVLRTAYREIFVRGRGPGEVGREMRRKGLLAEDRSLAEVIAEIEDLLDDATLGRITWDLQADQVGVISGQFLAYLEHAAADAHEAQVELSPERQLLHREARRTLARVDALIEELPEIDRRVLKLRFRRGWTAKRVAEVLELRDQREVYTVADRAIRRVRKLLGISLLPLFFLFLGRGW